MAFFKWFWIGDYLKTDSRLFLYSLQRQVWNHPHFLRFTSHTNLSLGLNFQGPELSLYGQFFVFTDPYLTIWLDFRIHLEWHLGVQCIKPFSFNWNLVLYSEHGLWLHLIFVSYLKCVLTFFEWSDVKVLGSCTSNLDGLNPSIRGVIKCYWAVGLFR